MAPGPKFAGFLVSVNARVVGSWKVTIREKVDRVTRSLLQMYSNRGSRFAGKGGEGSNVWCLKVLIPAGGENPE